MKWVRAKKPLQAKNKNLGVKIIVPVDQAGEVFSEFEGNDDATTYFGGEEKRLAFDEAQVNSERRISALTVLRTGKQEGNETPEACVARLIKEALQEAKDWSFGSSRRSGVTQKVAKTVLDGMLGNTAKTTWTREEIEAEFAAILAGAK